MAGSEKLLKVIDFCAEKEMDPSISTHLHPPMTKFSITCTALLLSNFPSWADQVIHFPEADPVVAFAAPDDWEAKEKNGSLFVLSPDGEGVIVELSTLEAKTGETKVAIEEAKKTISEFKDLKYGDLVETTSNTLDVTLLSADGEDKHGEASINLMLLGAPEAEHPVLVSMIFTKEGKEKYSEGSNLITKSLQPSPKAKTAKPDKDEADAEKAGDVQKFAYPAKGKADYSLEFPADWTLETTDEGAHVVSADKGIGMNIVMVDMADIKVAVESMKKKVGADYDSIEWSDPIEHDDAARKVKVASHDGNAMDGDTKYKVTFAQFTKKGSGKFMIILTQAPENAMTANGEALMKILMSFK